MATKPTRDPVPAGQRSVAGHGSGRNRGIKPNTVDESVGIRPNAIDESHGLRPNAVDESDGLRPNAVEAGEEDRSGTPKARSTSPSSVMTLKLARQPSEDIPLVERIRDIQRRTSKTMALLAK